jgi:hypothetical protein
MFNIENGMNRIDKEMSGKPDLASMKAALDELVRKSENIENGTTLCGITDYQLPTLSAIGSEYSQLPSIAGLR